jgi:serine/threonine-protein kinase
MTVSDPVRPGDVIADKYRIKAVIGHGGVGVVVAADHITLHRPVALKFLRPEIAQEPEVVQRFLREARAAARLRSEHVARVMDADSIEGGAAYLVMELLDGRDFGAILKEDGPLPVDVAVDYLVQACEAVAEAHSQGIVHRDLKSANLFLTRGADGTPLVKVLDFGLSRVQGSGSRASLTSANQVVGTIHYMSPEQMRSARDVDARSDIWSLGVVLYSFVTGRVPFEGTYLTEVCAAVLSGSAPSIASLRPDVPAGLADVIGRCLRLEPDERFQSVAELAAALAPYGLLASGLRVARVERLIGRRADSTPALSRHPTSAPHNRATFSPRALRRWAFALIGVAAAVGTIALFRRASGAGDRSSAPPTPSIAATVAAPPPAPTETTFAVQSESSRVESPPPTRGPVRRQPQSGTRRAATSTPATAPSGGARAEEHLILGLPH